MKHLSQVWNDQLIDISGEDRAIWGHISAYLWEHVLSTGDLFLYNMLTGSIDLMNAEESKKFRRLQKEPELTDSTLNQLKCDLAVRGHLWTDTRSEQQAAERMMQSLTQNAYKRPLMFFLCLTHTCPIGCRHCFELDIPASNQLPPMSAEKVSAAFRHMETVRKETGREGWVINLFGGEPFLPSTYESVRTSLDMAHKGGYRLTTFTSGVFLEPFLPLLKEHALDFDWISVTLDGNEEHHNRRRRLRNAFQRTAINIDHLLEANLPVIVRINLDRENIDHLAEFVEEYQRLGWTGRPNFRIQTSPVTDHHCVRTDNIVLDETSLVLSLEALRRELPGEDILLDRGCYFTLDYLAVKLGLRQPNALDYAPPGPRVHLCMSNNHSAFLFGADSMLYTCDEVVGNQKYAVGQYFPFEKMYEKPLWLDLMATDIPKCRTCRYLFLCGGGCTLAGIAQNGRPDLPNCPDVDGMLHRYVSNHEKDILEL